MVKRIGGTSEALGDRREVRPDSPGWQDQRTTGSILCFTPGRAHDSIHGASGYHQIEAASQTPVDPCRRGRPLCGGIVSVAGVSADEGPVVECPVEPAPCARFLRHHLGRRDDPARLARTRPANPLYGRRSVRPGNAHGNRARAHRAIGFTGRPALRCGGNLSRRDLPRASGSLEHPVTLGLCRACGRRALPLPFAGMGSRPARWLEVAPLRSP